MSLIPTKHPRTGSMQNAFRGLREKMNQGLKRIEKQKQEERRVIPRFTPYKDTPFQYIFSPVLGPIPTIPAAQASKNPRDN